MKKKFGKKFIGLFIVLCMVFITLPIVALGMDGAPDEAPTTQTTAPGKEGDVPAQANMPAALPTQSAAPTKAAAGSSDVKPAALINSQSALQSALHAAPKGATIYLDGNIEVDTQPIAIPSGAELTLHGRGRFGLTLAKGYQGRHLLAQGGDNGAGFALKDLTLQGRNEKDPEHKRTPGGGIYLKKGEVVLTNVTIQGNHSKEQGGAIYAQDTKVTLDKTTIQKNTAESGGGIYMLNGALLVQNNSLIAHNLADYGGGIYHENTAVALENSTLEGNTAKIDGGGIYAQGMLALQNATFTGNQAGKGAAGSGGALYYDQIMGETGVSVATIQGGNFLDNTASDQGGAIYNGDQLAQVEPVQFGAQPALFRRNAAPAGANLFTPFSTNATLTYDYNDGSQAPSSELMLKGNVALKDLATLGWGAVTPPAGKRFAGWNTQNDGGGTTHQPSELFDLQSDTTLFARWDAAEHSVTFEGNGGTITPGSTVVFHGGQLTRPVAHREGATCIGYLVDGTSTEWNFNDGVTRDLTLVAMWQVNKYTVYIDGNGGAVDQTQIDDVEHGQVIPPPAARREGYQLLGFQVQGTGVTWDFQNAITQNITLVAMWEKVPAPTVVPPTAPTPTPKPPIAAPITPAAPTGLAGTVQLEAVPVVAGTDLAPVVLPEMENGQLKPISLEEINSQTTPKGNAWREDHWTMTNALLLAMSTVSTLVLLIGYFIRRNMDTDYRHNKLVWSLLSLLVTMMAAAAFFLTQDIGMPMEMLDQWAILLLPMAIMQGIFMAMSLRGVKKGRAIRKKEEVEKLRQKNRISIPVQA